jgi:hypothetical protein
LQYRGLNSNCSGFVQALILRRSAVAGLGDSVSSPGCRPPAGIIDADQKSVARLYETPSAGVCGDALLESSVVQYGQRCALIGTCIAQAGHSFLSGSFLAGCLSLLIARTSRKTAPATIRKLIISVIKLP